jgi:hypothetical protein
VGSWKKIIQNKLPKEAVEDWAGLTIYVDQRKRQSDGFEIFQAVPTRSFGKCSFDGYSKCKPKSNCSLNVVTRPSLSDCSFTKPLSLAVTVVARHCL